MEDFQLEYECDTALDKRCYKLIDPMGGVTQEFDSLEDAFKVGNNLVKDLGVKLACPSYVLFALAFASIIPMDTAFENSLPAGDEVQWGGRLRFMNGTAGPSGETNG